jgi:hypothetical protein
MAGTCKLFQKTLLPKLDAEVQWLTDLTYNAFGYDNVEMAISWLTSKPSKRRELFGPSMLQRLLMQNNSASEGSGSRPGSHKSESGRLFALEIPQHLVPCFAELRNVPILILGGTERMEPKSGSFWIDYLARGAYGAQVWIEFANVPNYSPVPCMGLVLLMLKRVAESRSERRFRRLWWGKEFMDIRERPPDGVEQFPLADNWERATDIFYRWFRQCVESFWLPPRGQISKTKRLRRR